MPEQQNIEYKSSWHDDYLKWVCGFANAQGGRIYISKINRNYMGAPTQLRVYDNKLTLWNHGTLPDGITLDKLTKHHSSFPRNPILAEACFRGGYIDSWGSGIMKIMDSCKAAGLPTPMIEEDCGGLIVRLFKDRFSEEQLRQLELNDRQVDAVLFYRAIGEITSSEYAKKYNVSERTARRDLSELVENKLLKNEGDTNLSKYIFT